MKKQILASLPTVFALFLLPAVSSGQETSTYVRVIPLAVFDLEGNSVRGLRTDQVQVRGLEAELELKFDDRPRKIVILLDVSASMGVATPKWERAKAFVRHLLEAVGDDNEVALHAYAEQHAVISSPSRDRPSLLAALDSLPVPGTPEGKSRFGYHNALLDAILASLRTPVGFGDVIMLVADNVTGDRSQTKIDGALADMQDRGVRLFYINIGEPAVRPPIQLLGPGGPVGEEVPTGIAPYDTWRHWGVHIPEMASSPVSKVVAGSGGLELPLWESAVYVPRRGLQLPDDAVSAAAQTIYARMRLLYRLEIRLAAPLTKKKKLRVEIREQGKKRGNLRPFYPETLYPEVQDLR